MRAKQRVELVAPFLSRAKGGMGGPIHRPDRIGAEQLGRLQKRDGLVERHGEAVIAKERREGEKRTNGTWQDRNHAPHYNAAMKKLLLGFTAGLVVGGGLVFAISGAEIVSAAGLMQRGSPAESGVRILLENARVRVREVTFPPKQTAAMHTHALPHVGVVIQGGTLSFRYPDGRTETEMLSAGGAGYRDANVTHEPTNVGSTPVRVVEVELK